MNESMRKAENKGRSIFIGGVLIAIVLGLPLLIIGLLLGLFFKWFLLFWVGLGIIGIGIIFLFVGLILGASVVTKDTEQSVNRLKALENKNK